MTISNEILKDFLNIEAFKQSLIDIVLIVFVIVMLFLLLYIYESEKR
jgi:Na+/proline symporter